MWLLRCRPRLFRDLLAASMRGRAATGRMSVLALCDPLLSQATRSGPVPHTYLFLVPDAEDEAPVLSRVPTKPLPQWPRQRFWLVPGTGEAQSLVLTGDPRRARCPCEAHPAFGGSGAPSRGGERAVARAGAGSAPGRQRPAASRQQLPPPLPPASPALLPPGDGGLSR